MSASREDFGIAIRSALLQRGARQKFSLFFLLCISILIFFLDTIQIKPMNTVRALLNDGIYRFSSVVSSPFKFFSYLSSKSKKHMFTYKENITLKKELELLKSKNLNVDFLKLSINRESAIIYLLSINTKNIILLINIHEVNIFFICNNWNYIVYFN